MITLAEYIATLPATERHAIRVEADALIAEATLHQLRQAVGITQEELAQRLGVNQPAISRRERYRNHTVAALAEYVSALGGRLELTVCFPNGRRVALDAGEFASSPQMHQSTRSEVPAVSVEFPSTSPEEPRPFAPPATPTNAPGK
jgi:transcriptional regulator with XRE-family HTH domain